MGESENEHNIFELAGVTLGLQAVLAHVLGRIARVSPELAAAVRDGIDDAASDTENTTIGLAVSPGSKLTVETLRIIENMRSAVFEP